MPRSIRILGCTARPSKKRCVQNSSGVIDRECRIVNKKCVYDPTHRPSPRRTVLKKTSHVPVIRPEGIPLLKGCKYTTRDASKKMRGRVYCKTTEEGTVDAKCMISSKKRCSLRK